MRRGAESAGRKPIGVLICDDNTMVREMLRAVIGLRPSLSTVGEAGDGNEAVTEARRLQPDVILLDLAMPRRTGYDALIELTQVAPSAKIIVLSGFSTASLTEDVFERGAVRYLTKGADPSAINDAIEEAVSVVSLHLVPLQVSDTPELPK